MICPKSQKPCDDVFCYGGCIRMKGATPEVDGGCPCEKQITWYEEDLTDD